MKWIIGCLLALFLVTPALAGEDPYIAIVGNDSAFNPFYWSLKQQQFMFDAAFLGLPPDLFGTPAAPLETFACGLGSTTLPTKAEFCDTFIDDVESRGNPNCKAVAGNRNHFEWIIRLPKKPSGEINICLQCGVLKPNTDIISFAPPIEECAAETGERLGYGFCTRDSVGPGVDPIIPGALPTLTAIAFPGPFNFFFPFHLTAYKNPGTYKLPFWSLNQSLKSGGDSVTLDGSPYARILLKACMDKCVVVKIPTDGQINAGVFPGALPPIITDNDVFSPPFNSVPLVGGIRDAEFAGGRLGTYLRSVGLGIPSTSPIPIARTEVDLVQGDLIYIRLSVPNTNTVDIFCNKESASLRGVGESPN